MSGAWSDLRAQSGLQTFEREALIIETAQGVRHAFTVEVAVTPEQKAQGLMFRRTLAPDAGMLFLYRIEWPVAMWMKNTYIPLDMLFIGRDGRIRDIAERTVPGSLQAIAPDAPVLAVLELNGGTVERLGIKVGDRVIHPAFQGEQAPAGQ
ncbi:MAG: DUF192 domain-containing protein [Alphaproteobacteria bacterium]|nr:MAG: DUF192 domain-containing protein [Alphaproteobacteria bacterium]